MRNRGSEYRKKTDHSDVSRINTRIKENIFKIRGGKVLKRKRTVHRVLIMTPKTAKLKKIPQNSSKKQWCELSEVVDSDFLISPGDIYPNRKVELEDADIKEVTKVSFEALCEQQHEAFSKNNKDIGTHATHRNGNRYRR